MRSRLESRWSLRFLDGDSGDDGWAPEEEDEDEAGADREDDEAEAGGVGMSWLTRFRFGLVLLYAHLCCHDWMAVGELYIWHGQIDGEQ